MVNIDYAPSIWWSPWWSPSLSSWTLLNSWVNSEWWTLIWGKSRRGQRWVVTECPTKYISIIIIMKRIIKKIIMIIIKVDSTANDGLRMSTSVQVTKLVHRNRKSPKSGRKLSRPSFPNYHHLLFRPQIILFANLPFCAAATISQLSDFFYHFIFPFPLRAGSFDLQLHRLFQAARMSSNQEYDPNHHHLQYNHHRPPSPYHFDQQSLVPFPTTASLVCMGVDCGIGLESNGVDETDCRNPKIWARNPQLLQAPLTFVLYFCICICANSFLYLYFCILYFY